MTSWPRLVIVCLLLVSPLGLARAEIDEEPITDYDRDHWSFLPILRPALPDVKLTGWPQADVDFFILGRLEAEGLRPAPPARRSTLLRRLKFDLLGLPPTPEEVTRFEQDDSPDAYARLVDRFLASPAYGERWAQYWLDLARFAETDGFEHDKVRKNAWQYRQWVIDALNADLPYDQFIRLQLAGDFTGREEDAIATMFCLAGPDMPDINEQDLRRHDKLNEITSTVGAALLGLQMHCAQCHDHKYDPISQADFYRLRSIFEAAVPEMRRDRPVAMLSAQPAAVAPWLFHRGELHGQGPAVSPRPPRIASTAVAWSGFDTSQPRQALADWLFAPENPLTARVMAHRVWQHHFGRSLCENPSDFGLIAEGPSHPELLDWLATEFRRGGWSIKHLHRTILLSATYQQASHVDSAKGDAFAAWQRTLEEDSENELYSRFPRKRLEGEIIRDALLAVSGQLNREYGGPSVMPPLPPEMLSTLLKGQWQASGQPAEHGRRSIYVFARRNLRYPIFDVFDRPDAGASCPRRDRSTTALQSLEMLNGELAFQSARHLRDRLWRERSTRHLSHAELIERLFLITLSRHPVPEESQRFTELLNAPSRDARENLLTACLALLNASEFIYVD